MLFDQYDEDHNGYMDRKEFTEALKGLGLTADRKEVGGCHEINGTVKNEGEGKGDNKVTFEEFELFISKVVGVKQQTHHRQSTIT